MSKSDWDKERTGMLCTTPEQFGNWKTALEQLCHETKDCDQTKVKEAFKRLSAAENRAGVL